MYENGEIVETKEVLSITGAVPVMDSKLLSDFGLDVKDPWQSTYGYRFNRQSPALIDPTGDVVYGYEVGKIVSFVISSIRMLKLFGKWAFNRKFIGYRSLDVIILNIFLMEEKVF